MRFVRPLTLAALSAQAAAKNTDMSKDIPLVITTIDAIPVEGEPGRWEFDKNIVGKRNDSDALFLKDVTKIELGGEIRYRGTAVADMGAEIDKVARERGASHCLIYVHGWTNTPSVVFGAVGPMNQYYEGKKVFVVPVVWPADSNYLGQKEDAPGAANSLRSLVPAVMSTYTPLSLMCHSMGNFVLKKFAPDEKQDVRFKFDNIFMAAADVRATTFDKGDDTEDGPDILSICKKKVHVLWHWWDMALLGRRALNWGRSALGKIGKQYSKDKLIDEGAQLVYRECDDFNKQVVGWKDRWIGHGYHTTPGAMDYYLNNL